MIIGTSEFVTSHGTAPRGRGSWGFALKHEPTTEFWAQGTYAEARRALRTKHARTTDTWMLLP